MLSKQTQILNDAQVKQIVMRMAYQVYESNYGEKDLIIAGIEGNGSKVAELLYEELGRICKIRLHLLYVRLDKQNPSGSNVALSDEKVKITDKNVIVVDDVLNTGKTLVYGLSPFIRNKARQIRVAVLVDRNHKNFPISADFIGISLSTTLQEHITVSIDRKKVNVYLS